MKRALPLALLLGCAHGPQRDLLPQAHADLAAGKCEAAMNEFERAVASGARKLEAIRGRVEAAVKCGQLDKLLVSQPKEADDFYALGMAQFAAGNEQQSIESLKRAVELRPSEAEFHYRLGLAYEAGERWGDAKEPLSRAATLAPKVARMRPPLALCLGKLGQQKAAIDALRDFPRLSPTAEEANRALQVSKALTDLYRGLPPSARSDLEASLGYLVRDAPGVALPKLEELLARQPDLAPAHALLGLACARLDEAGRAISELREASRLAPDLPQPHAWLAQLYVAKERGDLAIPELEIALDLDPLDVASLRMLGELQLAKSDAKALPALQDAAALSPGDPALQLLLARAEIVAGRPQAAQARLESLAQQRPDDAEVLLRLALLLFDLRAQSSQPQRGEMGKRIEQLAKKVLTLQPENAMANQLLAKLKAG
jgi:tetratricopeptide (TPR) repeat protein